jgi:hypothetical protein
MHIRSQEQRDKKQRGERTLMGLEKSSKWMIYEIITISTKKGARKRCCNQRKQLKHERGCKAQASPG